MSLKVKDFTPTDTYFVHKLKDGGEICIEPCFGGYCVARYNERLDLIGNKVCTDMQDPTGTEIVGGLFTGGLSAFMKALEIANKMI